MAEEAYENNDTPMVMNFTIDPINFRNVIQRSIERSVNKEVDTLIAYKNTTLDGRYHNSNPSRTINMINPFGYPYFVVGASKVNCVHVAAP